MKALSFFLSILLNISSGSANPSAESISYTVTRSAINNFHREQSGSHGMNYEAHHLSSGAYILNIRINDTRFTQHISIIK